ncbi:MAG: hypothetical protein IIA59_03550 [Candidatus Marinimicrobia bacterium]|nr:hypothetical protein [Candidatus Neomarinimicrobiota bacterium]
MDELELVIEKYNIPAGWRLGLKNLLEKNLLLGNAEAFRLTKNRKKALKKWFDRNSAIVDMLKKEYGGREGVAPLSNKEKELAKKFVF